MAGIAYVDHIGVMFHGNSVDVLLHNEEEIRECVASHISVQDTVESKKEKVEEILKRLEENHYVSLSGGDEVCIFKAWH